MTYTHKKEETSHPPQTNPTPAHPRCLSVNYLQEGGGAIKTTKTTFQIPRDVGGEGGVTGQQVDLRCSSLARPAPLPRDEKLGSGPGAQAHTHTTHTRPGHAPHTHIPNTRTYTHIPWAHLCQMHKGAHTQSKAHTHSSAHSTDTLTLRLQNMGLGKGRGKPEASLRRGPHPSMYQTPVCAPSSTQVLRAQHCLGARCVTAEAGAPGP